MSSPPVVSGPPKNDAADAAAAFQIQNDARAGKNLALLNWDDYLAFQATEYAKILADANNGLNHSSGPLDPPQGENLYATTARDNPMTAAANAWIGESALYHGENIPDGDFEMYGHYSKSY